MAAVANAFRRVYGRKDIIVRTSLNFRGRTALATCAAAIAFGASLALATGPALAEGEIYAGKTVRMVVGSGVGGGYDIYARILARYLEKTLPGKPTFVTQNMEGAASLTATNWAYKIAPKDGTVILATANALLLEPLYGNKAAEYETTKFEWVGSIGKQQQVCVTWHASKAKTIADVQAQEFTVSATGASGGPAIWPRILNAMIGTKFKVIGGYTTGDSRLAVERGEVDGICGLAWSTLKTSDPRWVKEKLVNVLVQMGVKPQPGLENVPLVYNMVKSDDDRRLLELIFIPDEMGRPYAMPPGTPAQNVAAVRTAFDAVMRDKEFLAETVGRGLEVDPLSGLEMASLLQKAFATPRPMVEKASALLGREPPK
jgi:tripartite-type tricarboxylate transporter receptor subunit TctC